jgi:hypothetical protein
MQLHIYLAFQRDNGRELHQMETSRDSEVGQEDMIMCMH